MFNQERRKFLSRTAMAAVGLAISPLADLQASVLRLIYLSLQAHQL